jgi:hypothetical protein
MPAGKKMQEAIMVVDINEIIKNQSVGAGGYFSRVTCVDGLSFLPSAGYDRGSLPREFKGPWTEIEIGFCNTRFEFIFEPVRNITDPLTLKAQNVPVELINEMIRHHGGLATA